MSRNRYKYMTVDGKKIRVHRHIMQDFLGRKLESWEHVFHIDGDTNNNNIDNLVVIIKRSSACS